MSTQRELQIIEQPDAMRLQVQQWQREGLRVGLVPTMGALHAGHLSLIEQAAKSCDRVVTTIFVNPTQFGPQEDLSRYPRPFDQDLELCRQASVAAVFHPRVETMYHPAHATSVQVHRLTEPWEGRHRPGHFDGVATVVLKLFLIAPADVAFFGLKDYQQQLVIRQMVKDLNVPIEIVACPTVRETDGLAMSSRNQYLSVQERQQALILSQTLEITEQSLRNGTSSLKEIQLEMQQRLNQAPGIELEYFAIVDADTLEELSTTQQRIVVLVAARVGTTRLIDNALIDFGD